MLINQLKIKGIGILTPVFLLWAICAEGQKVGIVPQPSKVNLKKGQFIINQGTSIVTDGPNTENANYLQELLKVDFQKELQIKNKGKKGIVLELDATLTKTLGEEGYTMEVDKKSVHIVAATSAGVFYGIQSLRQLVISGREVGKSAIKVQAMKIEDKPRFGWRAFMLDEARYFKGMSEVKKLLDEMALLKMNVFHWHLTDDQGWRLEIKQYPGLTQIGSKRSNSQIGGWDSSERSNAPHSGYYTQEDIREIIAFASERHITIVPEIEMPGHASAAIAAYPWLGTVGDLKEVPTVFGKLPDSFNVSDPKVHVFLKNVLLEVMDLFPANTIHIGGDEVKFDAWKSSNEIQDFMKEKNLESPGDLHVYFTNSIAQYLNENGHRMMGWNEILGENVHEWQDAGDLEVKQDLAKNSLVHFWKGDLELVSKAVKEGYDIVNSYHEYTYLDYSYDYIALEKAYDFDPIPKGLEEQYHQKVLGSGCQMWGEWIPTPNDMDRMVFPRLAAYAEVGWTNKERKDYKVFRANLKPLLERWNEQGITLPEKFEKINFTEK
ncbi:glycoside hydrolase family 20 [Arenibacter aquaticus]|uniref:beta-N-acetylhexosaminidase n=1 Tax=Arenibacter aquaticus TaxID=2489054 RepID=A0A3S0D3Q6_9FLAO|nr:beta-N-acetylhexosaminidase [Arenibacter aquaticus]RTE52364.1 glycoside hydrolase family 20 [Arenibacter aquaticus]